MSPDSVMFCSVGKGDVGHGATHRQRRAWGLQLGNGEGIREFRGAESLLRPRNTAKHKLGPDFGPRPWARNPPSQGLRRGQHRPGLHPRTGYQPKRFSNEASFPQGMMRTPLRTKASAPP